MANNASSVRKSLDVVLLTPTLDGGVGRVTSLLARGMHDQGLSVTVWTLAGGAYDEETSRHIHVQHLTSKRALGSLRQLMTLLRTNQPRVVLSASFHMNCIAVIAQALSRVPIRLFLTEHTSLDIGLATIPIHKRLFARICIRLFYPQADGWIAVSKGVAQHMAKYAGLKAEHVTIIYNPVITPALYEQAKEPVDHPFFQAHEPVLLAVGRISAEKDYPTLLKAFHLVNAKTPTHLIILGDGPDRTEIEQLVERLELIDHVSLMGAVANPYPYFARSDLYVLSSTREGLPTTLVEALALGTKVVSTDCPSGPREILNDGAYGTLIPVGDPIALADAIAASLHSPTAHVPNEALRPYRTETAVKEYLHTLFPERV
ncbi:MAG: glycosyltransferase [Candidatus Paceibacterota bacterium]